MARDLIELTKRYHVALNAFDAAVVEPMFAVDAEYHSPSVGVIAGRAAIIAAMRGYFDEYADQVATDDSVEAAGPGAVHCKWRLKATARSTGEPYERAGAETVTFDAAGLIIRVEVQDR